MAKGTQNRIVVIGGVACGPKAASRARRRDPSAEITVIDKGSRISYAGCGLPYYIAGAVPEVEGLMTTTYGCLRDEEYFEANKNIKVRTRTEAKNIDPAKKTVSLVNLDSGKEETLEYDKLVIATGAKPVIPPIEGMNLKQVWTLRSPEDAVTLRASIEEGNADRVVIVGGGRIGLELTDAFGAQAVETTIVELCDQLLPGFVDKDIADYVANVLTNEKVQLRLGEKVLRLEGDENGKVTKVLTDKGEIEADAVLVAVGVRPNVDLAKAAGLKTGPTGAIEVDGHMKTSSPDIYAGGDCAEATHMVSGEKFWAPLGSTANRQGRVIGDNITGGDSVFPGIVGTSVMKTLGINVGRTGLTEAEAQKLGRKTIMSISPAPDRSHFFPGGKYITVKLVADPDTRKVLGVQVAGPGDVVRRVDIVATLLRYCGTLDDLAELDLCYAPPFGSAMENIHHAANIIRNKLEGIIEGISPEQMRRKIAGGESFAIVDVRIPEEVKKSAFPDSGAIAVPLDELRNRSSEVPGDKELFVLCQIGQRAYEGARILKGCGFGKVKIIDGGLNFWNSSKPGK